MPSPTLAGCYGAGAKPNWLAGEHHATPAQMALIWFLAKRYGLPEFLNQIMRIRDRETNTGKLL